MLYTDADNAIVTNLQRMQEEIETLWFNTKPTSPHEIIKAPDAVRRRMAENVRNKLIIFNRELAIHAGLIKNIVNDHEAPIDLQNKAKAIRNFDVNHFNDIQRNNISLLDILNSPYRDILKQSEVPFTARQEAPNVRIANPHGLLAFFSTSISDLGHRISQGVVSIERLTVGLFRPSRETDIRNMQALAINLYKTHTTLKSMLHLAKQDQHMDNKGNTLRGIEENFGKCIVLSQQLEGLRNTDTEVSFHSHKIDSLRETPRTIQQDFLNANKSYLREIKQLQEQTVTPRQPHTM